MKGFDNNLRKCHLKKGDFLEVTYVEESEAKAT